MPVTLLETAGVANLTIMQKLDPVLGPRLATSAQKFRSVPKLIPTDRNGEHVQQLRDNRRERPGQEW